MSEIATKANSVKCHICEKNYTTVSILNRHIQEVHKVDDRHLTENEFNVYHNKCLSCHNSFKYLRDLREHLVKTHDFVSEVEEHHFFDKEMFEEWFEETSKKEKVQYILRRGIQKMRCNQGEGTISVYYCNRSGRQLATLPLERRKRATKKQGSRKLNFACTSQIKVTEVNGHFIVTYYKTHYEHDKDLKHLGLLKSEKEEIARKLLAGVTTDEVLQEVRESAVENDIRRINLLSRRDINNIRQAYKINESVTNEEYVTTEEYVTNDDETLEYESSNETMDDCGVDDLKRNIQTEIETISSRVEGGGVQTNVLEDVYELLQAASALINQDNGESDSQTKRIETYYLTVDVDNN